MGNQINVIVADDEAWVRTLIRNMVSWKELGLNLVGEAENGTVALEECKRKRPDILITDIRMPGLDGLDLIAQVKEIIPELIPIIISGYDDFEYAQKAIRVRVIEYILKPINKNTLELILSSAVQRIAERRNELSDIHNEKMKMKKLEASLRSQDINIEGSLPADLDERIARVCSYLNQHIDENPTLERMADLSCMNKTYFSEMFKNKVGIGYGRYLRGIKLDKARFLLKNSALNVREIAESVGYSDAGYFSRVFKESFNLSPEEYRRSDPNISE